MTDNIMLGIDCGGTHTDGALLALENGKAALFAAAKTATMHDNLPASVTEVLRLLKEQAGAALANCGRVTLGTTLEINALVQGKADKVALALSAGPGLDPAHFALGENVCIVPGGLDHRGVEVAKLYTDMLAREAAAWPDQGVRAVAVAGKFSPRNPAHEREMAKVVSSHCHLPVTEGHALSGRLNFPRRIATAYYNAAVASIHSRFLDSVELSLKAMSIGGQARLLKADGGAISFAQSRREPVQSILSGPAASVMGALALWPEAASGCSLLLDMGGTTTDIAMFLNGSPVVDRRGMNIMGRRALAPSLASISIGIGGDSLISVQKGGPVRVGPDRAGPAAAFGGARAALLDALNILDGPNPDLARGDIAASRAAMRKLALDAGFAEEDARQIAQTAADAAMNAIVKAAFDLVESINSRPIYTLAALRAAAEARPERACVVGGPAACVRSRLEAALGMETRVSPHADVANAIGAALTRPTADLEIYADTSKGELLAPSLNLREKISASYSLEQAKERGLALLRQKLAADGADDARAEVVEADLFATLDNAGRGARDMRVVCQAVPGLAASML